MSVIVTEQDLRNNEFDKGAGGAWYYGTQNTHVHLITSGALPITVTAVSIKINDIGLGRLPELPSGRFDITSQADRWGEWKIPFQQALLKTSIGGEP